MFFAFFGTGTFVADCGWRRKFSEKSDCFFVSLSRLIFLTKKFVPLPPNKIFVSFRFLNGISRTWHYALHWRHRWQFSSFSFHVWTKAHFCCDQIFFWQWKSPTIAWIIFCVFLKKSTFTYRKKEFVCLTEYYGPDIWTRIEKFDTLFLKEVENSFCPDKVNPNTLFPDNKKSQ